MNPRSPTSMPGLAAPLIGLLVLCGAPAQAAPQVSVNFGFCTGCTLPTFVAPTVTVSLPGSVETPNNPYNRLTFGEGSIELGMNGADSTGFCCVNPDLYPGHNFNGYRMTFSEGVEITGATLVSFAPTGLTPEVTWTADTVYLNMWGGQVNLNSPVRVSFTTAAVPEPATTALLSAGLAAVAFAARRRPRAPLRA